MFLECTFHTKAIRLKVWTSFQLEMATICFWEPEKERITLLLTLMVLLLQCRGFFNGDMVPHGYLLLILAVLYYL